MCHGQMRGYTLVKHMSDVSVVFKAPDEVNEVSDAVFATIRKARDMMGTVEFTLCAFRVIKPIDFVLCLTGAAKSRLCSYQSLKAFQTEQLHSCVTSWCL